MDRQSPCGFKFTLEDIEVWRVAVHTDDIVAKVMMPRIKLPYNSESINESMIISDKGMEIQLLSKIREILRSSVKASLLFRGTKEKFNKANFIKNCTSTKVSVSPMLFLVKADNGRVFGGFTRNFNRSPGIIASDCFSYIYDKDAFMFCFEAKAKQGCQSGI